MTELQFRKDARDFENWIAGRNCIETQQNYVMLMEAWIESRKALATTNGKLVDAILKEFGEDGLHKIQKSLD